MRLSPGLGDRLKMVLRYITPEGTTRAFEFHAGAGVIALDPRWYQAASTFVKLGFEHILDGIDHLLFLLCLVAPFRLRHFRTLIGIITAFTVAHSITLIAAALGFVPAGRWFPPLVEVLIALSIVYMALENVVVALRNGQNAEASLRWRWLIAGFFGLVHGFGFSFALKQDLQFAGLALSRCRCCRSMSESNSVSFWSSAFSGTPEGEKVLAATPNLRRWFANISARPAFASTAPQFG